MTDERHYKINTLEIGHIYIDNLDGEHMSWIEVEETLNKLIDENEQLKQKNDNLIKISAMIQVRNDKLKEENEQLKQQITELSKENIPLDARVMDLQERLMNR